jgi:Spy/CpxP family protein refolding chaperone
MRSSPVPLLSLMIAIAVTLLAVPFVLQSQFVAQQPSAPTRQENASDTLSEFDGKGRPTLRKGRRRGEVLQQLNLTPEQLQKLSAVRNQYQPLIRERAQSVRAAQRQLRRLLASDASESDVTAQYQQVQQLRQDLHQERFKSVLAMRQILTLEQRQAFESGRQSGRERERPGGRRNRRLQAP